MSYYFHFTGTPCLRHTNYTFYKSFKYKLSDDSKVLSLGDFFFLKILQDVPVCIGEIELLWEDKASNQLLASVRLYFRPEHTPEGRQDFTGEDEIVVLGERLVLRLDDLLPLIVDDFKWEYGYQAPWISPTNKSNGNVVAVKQEQNGHDKSSSPDTPIVIKDEGEEEEEVVEEEEEEDWMVSKVDSPQSDDADTGPSIRGAANIAVMSFPRYCRYRAMMRRLEGCENKWLKMAVVMALGSFAGKGPGCRVMFCKEAFYHSEIDDLDIRMDHMMPTLKNSRPRGKKKKDLSRKDSQQDSDSTEEIFANITPTISTSSRPRRSTDTSELTEDKVNAEEQAFLIGLHKFMHDAKIPIGRIPSLGFKQIDLYLFYKHAEKLGGYDAITTKRMWKHLYDKMGGNSSNTSAATCTRRHYERLLLPYERHLRKLKGPKSKKKTIRAIEHLDIKQEKKEEKENVSNETEVKRKKEENCSGLSSVKVKENLEGEKIATASVVPAQPLTQLPLPPPPPQPQQLPPPTPQQQPKQPPPPPPPREVHQDQSRGKSTSSSSTCHDPKNETELLEIPYVRQRHNQVPTKEQGDKGKEGDGLQLHHPMLPPNLAALGLTEQQLMAGVIPGAMLPPDFGAADGTVIPNTNLVYRGGYLMPLNPQQIMQTPWGLMAAPPLKQESMDSNKEGSNKRKDQHPTNSSGTIPSHAHDKSSSSKNSSSADSMLFPGALNNSPHLQNQQQHQKAAHTNTPYQPSPYLLTDHINNQQQRPSTTNLLSSSSSSSASSSKLHLNNILANSSQNLITLLHPTPSGRKSNPNLPRAPSQVYLHPSSTNPLSPSLPSPNGAVPPPAHSQPKKRTYPFDHPSQGSLFPSPDIVLDRIKSSTGLRPGGQPAPRQRFDSPRDIFTQNKQTFAAACAANNGQPSSHHHQPLSNHQRKPVNQQPRHQPQIDNASNQKRPSSSSSSSSKLKSSSSSSSSIPSSQRKLPHHHQQHLQASSSSSTSTNPSLYPMMPTSALELQSLQMQALSAAAAAATNGIGPVNVSSSNASAALRDQMTKQQAAALSSIASNGLVLPPDQQQALAKAMSTPESQLAAAAAAKEGHRLTSALFGTQFTAMPRPTSKQSDPSSSSSSSMPPTISSDSVATAAAQAAAAMSFNPHIHPAFMSPYLPPGVSAAALSPQIQMQMAAYEELLRQNGMGAFMSPGGAPPPAKVGKKN